MKKQQLSLEQHAMLGQELSRFSAFFSALHIELCNRYGKSTRPAKSAASICNKLMRLRSDMEAPLFEGHPGQATTRVYYPLEDLGEVQTPNFAWLRAEENTGRVYL